MAFKSERFLVDAVEQGQAKKVIKFVQNGHNINVQNTLGENLLIHILKQQQQQQDPILIKKYFRIFRLLLTTYGLDVHAFDSRSKNVFNWAANLNSTKEALYLLRSYPGDIDILVRDHSGSCSLHYAVEHANQVLIHAIVDYLLQYRLRFDIKDAHNNTPEDLARKLGHNDIADYLAETSRLTAFMSIEIPPRQRQARTARSKATTTTVSSSSTKTSLASSLDASEYYNQMETRIEAAKTQDDWRTVAALRAWTRNVPGKLPTSKTVFPTKVPVAPSAPPKLPPITVASPLHSSLSPKLSQSQQMLQLITPQLTTSYRRAFVPVYRRSFGPAHGFLPPSGAQRKMSQASSRRLSSVMSNRKRDSIVSQFGGLRHLDAQSRSQSRSQLRLSIPQQLQKHRQSTVLSRQSGGDGLLGQHPRNSITVHN